MAEQDSPDNGVQRCMWSATFRLIAPPSPFRHFLQFLSFFPATGCDSPPNAREQRVERGKGENVGESNGEKRREGKGKQTSGKFTNSCTWDVFGLFHFGWKKNIQCTDCLIKSIHWKIFREVSRNIGDLEIIIIWSFFFFDHSFLSRTNFELFDGISCLHINVRFWFMCILCFSIFFYVRFFYVLMFEYYYELHRNVKFKIHEIKSG